MVCVCEDLRRCFPLLNHRSPARKEENSTPNINHTRVGPPYDSFVSSTTMPNGTGDEALAVGDDAHPERVFIHHRYNIGNCNDQLRVCRGLFSLL
jgi:hypothetical protein